MTFYVFLYISYVLFCYGFVIVTRSVSFKKIQSLIIFSLFVIINGVIVALRPIYLSPDTSIYYVAWEKITLQKVQKFTFFELFFNRSYYSIEIGFLFLMAILKKFMSFRVFLWLISVIISCLSCYSFLLLSAYSLGINHSKKSFSLFVSNKLVFIWVVYLLVMGILYTSVAIRSGLSIAVSIFGISSALVKNKKIVPLISIILATLIHTSSILFFILWILLIICKKSHKLIKQSTIACIWMGLSFVYFLQISEYTTKLFIIFINLIRSKAEINGFSSYLSNIEYKLQLREGYCIFFMGLYLFLTFRKTFWFSNFALITIFGLFLAVFATPVHAMSRITDLFTIFLIPIIGAIPLEKGWKSQISYYGVVLFLLPQYIVCFARIV